MAVDASGLEFCTPIEVRFSDLDVFGHVNNVAFGTYFENARLDYYREMARLDKATDIKFVVARLEINYKSPIWLNDEVECVIGVTVIGKSSFDFEYVLRSRDHKVIYADGRTVHVMFDFAAQKSLPVSAEVRRLIGEMRARKGLAMPAERDRLEGRQD